MHTATLCNGNNSRSNEYFNSVRTCEMQRTISAAPGSASESSKKKESCGHTEVDTATSDSITGNTATNLK